MGGYVYNPTVDEIFPTIWGNDGHLISTFDLAGYQVSEIIDDHGTNVVLLNVPNFTLPSYLWAEGWAAPRLVYGDLLPALTAGDIGIVKDVSSGGALWLDVEVHGSTGSVTSYVASILTQPFAIPVPNFTGLPAKTGVASTVHWDPITGASSYRVQINNLTTKTVRSIDVVTTNSLSVTITDASRYAIWIQAISDTGITSPWSVGTGFTVVVQAPALNYSAGNLSWTNTGAASYRLWINNRNGQKVVDQTTSETSLPLTLSPGDYVAWVKADAAVWSSAYRFTIYHDAITVNPLATFDTTPVVSWPGDVAGNYLVWVSIKGQTAALQTKTVTGNSVELDTLPRGDYTVWVRQLHSNGSYTLWGPGSSLSIATRPVATLSGTTLSWTPFEQADHYEFWLSTDANTDRITIAPDTVTGTSIDLSGYTLPHNIYRIWVRAVSNTGTIGQWGYAQTFVV